MTIRFRCDVCGVHIAFEGLNRRGAAGEAIKRGWRFGTTDAVDQAWVIDTKCRCPKCAKKEVGK